MWMFGRMNSSNMASTMKGFDLPETPEDEHVVVPDTRCPLNEADAQELTQLINPLVTVTVLELTYIEKRCSS